MLSVLQSCARAVQLNMRSNPNSIKLGGCWLYLEVSIVNGSTWYCYASFPAKINLQMFSLCLLLNYLTAPLHGQH